MNQMTANLHGGPRDGESAAITAKEFPPTLEVPGRFSADGQIAVPFGKMIYAVYRHRESGHYDYQGTRVEALQEATEEEVESDE